MRKHRVVIIGSGFGGLFAAKALKRADVEVTLIARTTHHLFQPLLYQVATGILSEGEIAPATREVLRKNRNVTVQLGLVEGIDVEAKQVRWRFHGLEQVTEYDTLIVAAGAGQSYFGNDHFARHAPGMKTIDDALELRARIFGAFELAELAPEGEDLSRFLTFAVVGAGPTGVEMAGQIRELASKTLVGEFRRIDPKQARVILIEGGPLVLPSFGEALGGSARRSLERRGVEIWTEAMVTEVDSQGFTVKRKDGSTERVESVCKVWAAGVAANPLGAMLAEQTGAETDRAGRVKVQPDLTLPGHPEVFVIGDLAALDGVPGVAQGAIQGAAVQRVAQGHVLAGPQGALVALIRGRRGCGPAAGCHRCGPEAKQRQQQRGGPGSQPHGLTGTAGARCARGASRASGPDRIPAAHAVSRTTGPGGRRARGAAS